MPHARPQPSPRHRCASRVAPLAAMMMNGEPVAGAPTALLTAPNGGVSASALPWNPDGLPLWDRGGDEKHGKRFWHSKHACAVEGVSNGRHAARLCNGVHLGLPHRDVAIGNRAPLLKRLEQRIDELESLKTDGFGSLCKLYGEARDLTDEEERVRSDAYEQTRLLYSKLVQEEADIRTHFARNTHFVCHRHTPNLATALCTECAGDEKGQREAPANGRKLNRHAFVRDDAQRTAAWRQKVDELLMTPIFNPPQRKSGCLRDTAPDVVRYTPPDAGAENRVYGEETMQPAPEDMDTARFNTRYLLVRADGSRSAVVRVKPKLKKNLKPQQAKVTLKYPGQKELRS